MHHNSKTQFARLLCELVANNEDLNLVTVAEEMDLELSQVQAIFDCAHDIWEQSKMNGGEFEFEAELPGERYWLGMQNRADVGVLHNEDGVSIDLWTKKDESAPLWSVWFPWDVLLPEEN